MTTPLQSSSNSKRLFGEIEEENKISSNKHRKINKNLISKLKEWKKTFPLREICKADSESRDNLEKEQEKNHRNLFFHFTGATECWSMNENDREHKAWVKQAISCAEQLKKVSIFGPLLLGDLYYVFTHGQMGQLLPLAILNKELVKLDPQFKDRIYHAQKWMYHPETLPDDELSKELYTDPNFQDHPYSNYLLAADARLKNKENGESAYCYLLERTVSSLGALRDTCKKEKIEYISEIAQYIIALYVPRPKDDKDADKKYEGFFNEFIEIVKNYSPKSNLWIFAIPFDKMLECGYVCRALGAMAPEWGSPNDKFRMLADMQENKLIGVPLDDDDSDSDDEIENRISSYQVRLFKNKLNDPGILSFHVPEMNRNRYSKLKNAIKDLSKRLVENKLQAQIISS